jgi:putative transposase
MKDLNNKTFIRKRPAHLSNVDRNNDPTILFVTICTKDRKNVLANQKVHDILVDIWMNKATHYIVGKYIIMPNHIHLFCSPATLDANSVINWVGFWKRLVSQELKELDPLWQDDCWDTQIRNSDKYTEKWNYVKDNPVRKGLAKTADDWPFKGCLNELRW